MPESREASTSRQETTTERTLRLIREEWEAPFRKSLERLMDFVTDFPARCPDCDRCKSEAHKLLNEEGWAWNSSGGLR